MQIIGIGTDIVELARLQKAMRRGGNDFTALVFAASEPHPTLSDAGCRWAAKEACAKALGCGIGEFCRMNEIEICGRPEKIRLHGAALQTFTALGGRDIHLAVAYERHYAIATVIITGGNSPAEMCRK